MDEIQAAILRVKLKYLDEENRLRINFAKEFSKNILNEKLILPKVIRPEKLSHVFHLYVVRVEHRDTLRRYLLDNGIQSEIHYPKPIHKQDAFLEMNSQTYEISEMLHRSVVSIPNGIHLEERDLEKIIDVLNKF